MRTLSNSRRWSTGNLAERNESLWLTKTKTHPNGLAVLYSPKHFNLHIIETRVWTPWSSSGKRKEILLAPSDQSGMKPSTRSLNQDSSGLINPHIFKVVTWRTSEQGDLLLFRLISSLIIWNFKFISFSTWKNNRCRP